MAKPFSERLQNGLTTSRMSIETREDLATETDQEAERAEATFKLADAEACDPLLSDEDRDEAARKADQARRLAKGYRAAAEKLREIIIAQRESDKHKAREAEVANILAERDAIAEELAYDGRAAIERLIEILSKVEANKARMQAASIREPDAEAKARGIPYNYYLRSAPVSKLVQMKIPEWSGPGRQWPVDRFAAGFLARENLLQKQLVAAAKASSPKALATAKAAEDAKWRRYAVSQKPYCGKAKAFSFVPRNQAYEQQVEIGHSTFEAELTEHQVEKARSLGFAVEPVTEKAPA